jgi:hypothetical protein
LVSGSRGKGRTGKGFEWKILSGIGFWGKIGLVRALYGDVVWYCSGSAGKGRTGKGFV